MTRFLTVLLLASVASAGPREDFAFSLDQYTGGDYRTEVVDKLVTLHVGAKCRAKLADKNFSVIETAAAVATEIGEYAKVVTGDDWAAIEGDARDKDRVKPIVASKIDAFRSRFGMSISVEGDDCDAKKTSLWLGYWVAVMEAVRSYPPPSGKAFIALEVTPNVKEVSYRVSNDGTTFTFRAPRDIEPGEWIDRLGRPFRQLVAGLPDDFAFSLMEHIGEYTRMWMVTRFTTFNVGKTCRARFSDRTQAVLASAAAVGRDMLGYVHRLGADDWSVIEHQRANDPKTNQTMVYKMMDEYRGKLSVTVNVDGEDCDTKGTALWLRYWTSIAGALEAYPPNADKVSIVLNVSAKTKGMTATVANGSLLVFTGARDIEPDDWLGTIERTFKRNARKR